MAESQSLKSPKEEERESDELSQSCQLETLVVRSNSEDLKPTVTIAALAPPGFKTEPFGMPNQEALACVTVQAQAQTEVQTGYSYSSEDLLPVPIEQSLSATVTPIPLRQRSPILCHDDNSYMPEVNQEGSSDQKLELAQILPKSPSPDGYNWRKYGQKPVKSNDSARSYYRCTHINCHAKKKVERCDHSSRIIEIIYKGRHNHDPPQKTRRVKAGGCLSTDGAMSSPEPIEGSGITDCTTGNLNCSSPPTCMIITHAASEQKLDSSRDCSSNATVDSEEKCDQARKKQRAKGQNSAFADAICKTIREPKIVVQSSDEFGTSNDGYRWRKYGQKMVKGNSNPRSYYKCTSAGCPARKHVEKSRDDASSMMITYERTHDHDMPVLKKHNHNPPSTPLPITAPPPMNVSEPLINPEPSTQCPMDVEKEVVSENPPSENGGGEKALESARTLLSIGIELRPC